jgi:hypothetical protein
MAIRRKDIWADFRTDAAPDTAGYVNVSVHGESSWGREDRDRAQEAFFNVNRVSDPDIEMIWGQHPTFDCAEKGIHPRSGQSPALQNTKK